MVGDCHLSSVSEGYEELLRKYENKMETLKHFHPELILLVKSHTVYGF